MTIFYRTKFSDYYLLEKIRAVALTAREPDPAAQRIVNLVHDAFDHFSWTGLYLRRARSLLLAFHRGADAIPPEPSEPFDGLLGWAVRSRRTQILPGAATDPRYARIEIPIQSEIVVPIKVRNRSVGLLDICSGRPGAFSRVDVDFLGEAADLLAPLVQALAERSAETPEVETLRRAFSA